MLGYFVGSESELIHSPLPSGEGRGPIPPAGSAVGGLGVMMEGGEGPPAPMQRGPRHLWVGHCEAPSVERGADRGGGQV